MRARSNQAQQGKFVAISSEHSITLAYDFPPKDRNGLLGVAIRRRNPDGTIVWLEGLLAFEGYPHLPGEPLTSNIAPFQKMYWADYMVREGFSYDYSVVPVYGQAPNSLILDEQKALTVSISTESGQSSAGAAHDVQFNRAVVSSQAYTRNFGAVDPSSDSRILQWLARGLDTTILSFIKRASDDSAATLEIAAYHLDHADIIQAIARLGSRAAVVLDPAPDSNLAARYAFSQAGVEVSFRENVPGISHNKFMVLSRSGQPQEVLMGSTNFTVSGVSTQNNVCHVIRNAALAATYSQYFTLLRADDNKALRTFNAQWSQPDPAAAIHVNFSPHKTGARVDLDEYVRRARGTQGSILFAMFMGTDPALITALTQPPPGIVVRGLVNDITQGSTATEGQVMLYHEAHDHDPAVVAARPLVSATGPFLKEQKRVWTGTYFVPMVHHKFIVLGFPGTSPCVITGSANYSKNSTEKNDENTLIIENDDRIVDMYVGELLRIYEHYRSRWFIDSRVSTRPDELYLNPTDKWIGKYYNPSKESAKFLTLLLSAA